MVWPIEFIYLEKKNKTTQVYNKPPDHGNSPKAQSRMRLTTKMWILNGTWWQGDNENIKHLNWCFDVFYLLLLN